MSDLNLNEEDWNAEFESEVNLKNSKSLIVYSRDWTVETILSQINAQNIDLNPKFQRRNAWDDKRKSKLIESLIIGVPVPEIVLAEDPQKKKSFIVIDGKQRLLTLAGFFDPGQFNSWKKPALRDLNTRSELNGNTKSDIEKNETVSRELLNADIRCTVISNYSSNNVLYDIFYRLNTGSVPLSSQELRQVLNKGEFADYLIEATNEIIPLHQIMNLQGPDTRLRDAEILLRFISFKLRGQLYKGNLSEFLDQSMGEINDNWSNYMEPVKELIGQFNETTSILYDLLGSKVGKKFSTNWETRFNRVLFEVEVFFFSLIEPEELKSFDANRLINDLSAFMNGNQQFLESIESSTKNLERYRNRYVAFQNFTNTLFHKNINAVPF